MQAVQTGADAHAVPSARKETRIGRRKATARRRQEERENGQREGRRDGRRRGAGVALHASHSIRRSRVCPVHADVSLRASVAGERQELPRA